MKQLLLAAVAISLALAGTESFAAKLLVYVQPNGSAFTVEPLDEGIVRFTVVRDPAKTREPSDPELRIVRSAHLTVSDGKRDLVTAPIAPRTMKNGHLKYSFKVLKEYAPSTTFRMSEIEEYKGRTGYIGGGTIFIYQMEEHSPLPGESKP